MRTLYRLVAFLGLGCGLVSAQTYGWFVNEEPGPFGENGDRPGFVTGDTLNARVHSNGQIAISGSPVFYGQVTTSANDFYHGPDYNPIFVGPPPVFNVMMQPIPDVSSNVRAYATRYESPGWDKQQRMVLYQSNATLYTWDLGVAFDSLEAVQTSFPITNHSCFFTEAPLELIGHNITGGITIGSAGQIRLMDDVRVGGPTSGPPEYRVAVDNPNYVGIVSEEDIKIANTPANGRENSNGFGHEQTNPSYTDIVLTAAIVAMGGLQMENQNDPDSGYVCDCSPDFRGNIFLYGMIAEGSRGFHRRTNNGVTGYEMHLRYDDRFLHRMPPCFFGLGGGGNYTEPEAIDFGDVPVDSTAWDTVEVYVEDWGALALVSAPLPFHGYQIPPQFGFHFTVPVSFHPHYATQASGVLQILASGHLFQVPLHGMGVNGDGPRVVGPKAYPNPFNACTVFTFSLDRAGETRVEVYDVAGRLAATVFRGMAEAGEHRLTFDARDLPSGVYFACLEAAGQIKTTKILLVK